MITQIPVEDDGGGGTAGGHPEEGFENGQSQNNRYNDGILHPGLEHELMTGWAENSNSVSEPFSRITIAMLEDMGFSVNYSVADSYTL